MIETFYEQIKEYGVLAHHNETHNIETYYYNDSHVYVYLEQGKPIFIIVSNKAGA